MEQNRDSQYTMLMAKKRLKIDKISNRTIIIVATVMFLIVSVATAVLATRIENNKVDYSTTDLFIPQQNEATESNETASTNEDVIKARRATEPEGDEPKALTTDPNGTINSSSAAPTMKFSAVEMTVDKQSDGTCGLVFSSTATANKAMTAHFDVNISAENGTPPLSFVPAVNANFGFSGSGSAAIQSESINTLTPGQRYSAFFAANMEDGERETVYQAGSATGFTVPADCRQV